MIDKTPILLCSKCNKKEFLVVFDDKRQAYFCQDCYNRIIMNTKLKKLENEHLAKKIGNYSYIQILWKDWKKELPPPNTPIFVIVKLRKGYYSLLAEYSDTCKEVRFNNLEISEIYLGTKDEKMLIAWGQMEDYKPEYN